MSGVPGAVRPLQGGLRVFHPLRVAAVDRLTDDAVALTLAVPEELRATYRYAPGQHIALRRTTEPGEEIRRTYSLCAPAEEEPATLRVGIRLVEGGEFSTYALKELTVGRTVEALPPTGRFVLEPRRGRFAAVVGGSGITPVLSMAATLLAREPQASFCLIRSDRTTGSTMFLEEVADLKDRYPERFQLVTVLSREEQESGLPTGRLDEERLRALLPALLPEGGAASMDGWYLCGPLGLVEGASRALRTLEVPREHIHQEIFHAEAEADTNTDAGATAAPPRPAAQPSAGSVSVRAVLAGRSGTWPVDEGESVLEAVLRNRPDAPYACKGGVCGTCRVRLLGGEVHMERNYALEEEELKAGYVLACQSRPLTEKVEVDFDA
ncbi:2Fe-2S iron-sulfur cluster-binding protein [Streptomyces sp. NHF165]|uniref:2Fe-2S iron-sulfur cluster-binding protein n=1 Tax=Streptomyces sp. NHF165 TaxID=2175864 RepID=UPI003FCDAC9B